MIYKHILFLSLFLMPYTMVAKNSVKSQAQIDEQIQELKEKIFQKELEIFNLSEKISEIDKRLLSLHSEPYDILDSMLAIEIIKNQNNGKSLSQEDQDKILMELRNSANEFLLKIGNALEKNEIIKGMLVKNLFKTNKNTTNKDLEKFDTENFDSIKFYLLRRIFDKLLIRHLIEKYDNCIAEYSVLMNELIDLQKQSK